MTAGPRRRSSPASSDPSSRRGVPGERTPDEELAYTKERALRLLAVRPRSRAELADRLTRANLGPEAIEQALADLERVGLVDDDAFARELVAARMGNRLEGNRAVRAALRAKGVDPRIAERTIEEAGSDEGDRALELAQRRARRLAGIPPEKAYGRLVAFLQRRGHGYGVAASAARHALRVESPEESI